MSRRSFLVLSFISIAASAAVALIEATMDSLRLPANTFAWSFQRLLLAWMTLGVLAPAVILLAQRVRFGRTPGVLAFAFHGAAAFLVAAVHYAMLALAHRLLLGNPEPYWESVRALFLYYAHLDVITYSLIVGAVHAWLSHNEARERELAAQTLRADLSEARLKALRAQLHPHFLFNAMNAITMLVRGGKQAAAIGTVTKLGDLLRRVLRENPGHQVPLREEIDFVRQYLEIERTRFGDRLRITIDAPDDTLDVIVPDLILQPLVENAMRHGVARTGRRCHLSVTARRTNSQLTLSVSDDAMGLPAKGKSTRPGVGLQNTAARLVQLHGAGARLNVGGNELGGVTAQVILPVSLQIHRPSLRDLDD